VYDRYEAFLARKGQAPETRVEDTAAPEEETLVRGLLFHVEPGVNALYLAGRAVLLVGLVFLGLKFMLAPVESNISGRSFIHMINLPFHEAGHILFRPFGQFVMMLGGSLMQLLIPAVCMGAFLFQTRDPFAASVALWWLGESFIDLAPYIGDARALKLVLIGGVTGRDVADFHDWEFILRKTGLLRFDHALAALAQITGIALMLTSFAWCGYMLYKQFRNLDR
jgi:hypothetical protein